MSKLTCTGVIVIVAKKKSAQIKRKTKMMQSFLKTSHKRDIIARILIQFERKNHHASTIDTNDVEHHSKFAADWWNPRGPVAPLHSLNKIR